MSDTTIDPGAESAAAAEPGIAVTINGRVVTAREGELVIDAAERHGVYIPRFCYHPRMNPVGMCRMCIVEIDTGRGPALLPSCMIECTPEMEVDTTSEVTTKAQDGVLEFLLVNHPLDCPVCDKGGECPLQDQTMAYGPGESRFVEEKRHKEKPIPISDLVLLDRERCILCDRCTRFAKDVAGDPLIHFINRGNDTEINTFPDEPFSSYFSGNTVQICPVGALTATSYRFKARPWDLHATESTCQGCSVGCRVSIESSRNEVLRYQGVDIDPVNWGWLCDKGRFGFEAVISDDRLDDPLVRDGDDLVGTRWVDALGKAADALGAAAPGAAKGSIAVLGGARLTNESAYAWAKLAKGVLGTDHVDAQLGDGLPAEVVLGLPRATIDDVCAPGGTVILLGPDLKEELPVLYLRLRHAAVEDGATIIEISPQATGLSRYAAVSLHPRPGEAGVAVRALLDGAAPGTDAGGVDATDLARAAVLAGKGPVTVVIGRQSLAESGEAVVDAAAALLARRPDTRFLPVLRRANVNGALDMGLAPGLLPGRVTLGEGRDRFGRAWSRLPAESGSDARGILQAAADGRVDVLVLLGADPLSDFPDHDLATRALVGARTVIALDQFPTASVRQADIVLPTAGFAEVEGTSTNIEGRVSVLNQKVTGPGTARADWIIAAELARRLGTDLGLESVEGIQAEIAALAPAHAGLTPELLDSPIAHDGVLVPLATHPLSAPHELRGTEGFPLDGQVSDTDAHPPASAGSTAAPAESVAPAAAAAAADAQEEREGHEAAAQEAQASVEADAADAADPAVGEPAPPSTPPGPALVTFVPGPPLEPPPLDSYSLRLVATRKLYDQGTLLAEAPALAKLAPGTILTVNPYDFDRLGVAPGDRVRMQTSRTTLTAEIAADDGVPRGSASVVFNQPGLHVAALIDSAESVTVVRVETEVS
jgi:NADH-quinone oxidoreductase subunit G